MLVSKDVKLGSQRFSKMHKTRASRTLLAAVAMLQYAMLLQYK
jgi:hypothetical protein